MPAGSLMRFPLLRSSLQNISRRVLAAMLEFGTIETYFSTINLINFSKFTPYFLYRANEACSKKDANRYGVIERGGRFNIVASQVQPKFIPRTFGFPKIIIKSNFD